MASNKFATMLHRNTHRITAILVYALLEWILIILLLLNSFFTYLITKFANFFGLKPPCVWCSRVDHILEPGKNTHSYTDLVCDTHATEISKLSYCSNHRKLADTHNMCENCLASRPNHNDKSIGMTRRIAFITLVSGDKVENGEKFFGCSCCNESLNNKLYPPYLLFKSSWSSLDNTQKGDLIIEAIDDDDSNGSEYKEPSKPDSPANQTENDEGIERNNGEEHDEEDADENGILSDVENFGAREVTEEDCSRSVSNLQCNKEEGDEDEEEGSLNMAEQNSAAGTDFVHRSCDDTTIRCSGEDDDSLEIINLHFEKYIVYDFDRLIPIEMIDSSTTANQRSSNLNEDLRKCDHQNETFDSALEFVRQAKLLVEAAALMDESAEKTSCEVLESLEMGICGTGNSSEESKQDLAGEAFERVTETQEAQTLSTDGNNVQETALQGQDDLPADEEIYGSNLSGDQSISRTSIGTEVPDHAANQPQAQEPISSLPCQQEDQSSTNASGGEILCAPEDDVARSDLDTEHTEKATVQEKMILVDKNQEGINHHLSMRSEPNDVEEEKLPDTPTSIESLHHLHKKLLLFEKRESGTEESLDGSVVSEMEGGEAVLTIERLKSALKSERKALSALYAELEEERSASAIAANQTMAMITRLQEEKAAMQMEALQYQRMMEEQSEYDQEALQLLNELMIKREKEKQELEKELEVFRKKVSDYEAKEKMRMMRRSKDGSVRSRYSSASFSNADDSDEISIDLNREARDEDNNFYGHQESSSNNTPADEVLNLEEIALDCVKHMSTLDESLTEFEEERLSILDQLKALEEKLITLGDDEFIEDLKSIEHSSKYHVSEFDENHDFSSPEEIGVSDEFSKDRTYTERKTMGSMAKSLLPLLDATDNETEVGLTFEEQIESMSVEMQNSSVSKFEMDSKKLAIEDEVDHVYERLQALEADREFLKHCMTSIKKGDKGMDLLQEILQHLRDLRAVELRVRNMSDGSVG